MTVAGLSVISPQPNVLEGTTSDGEIINVDGVEYSTEDLNNEAKAVVESLRFVEQEIVQTQARVAVLNTAKSAYINSLKAHLRSDSS